MKIPVYIASLIASFVLGCMFTVQRSAAQPEPQELSAGAYLVAGWNVKHPDQMKPFGDAVVPLARQAGFKMLAGTSPEVLEGEWPYTGILIVQKYDSIQALRDFWFSREHEAAKKLRAGHVDSHFVLGVEARREADR